MRRISILALLLVLTAIIACEQEEPEPATEQFAGTYKVYDPGIVGEKLDSVLLTVEDKDRYEFVHYPSRPGAVVNICNSSGVVSEFGTNFALFFPQSFDFAECDSLRIPRDSFVTDFRNHGDTIWMDRDDGTLKYELRLR